MIETENNDEWDLVSCPRFEYGERRVTRGKIHFNTGSHVVVEPSTYLFSPTFSKFAKSDIESISRSALSSVITQTSNFSPSSHNINSKQHQALAELSSVSSIINGISSVSFTDKSSPKNPLWSIMAFFNLQWQIIGSSKCWTRLIGSCSLLRTVRSMVKVRSFKQFSWPDPNLRSDWLTGDVSLVSRFLRWQLLFLTGNCDNWVLSLLASACRQVPSSSHQPNRHRPQHGAAAREQKKAIQGGRRQERQRERRTPCKSRLPAKAPGLRLQGPLHPRPRKMRPPE